MIRVPLLELSTPVQYVKGVGPKLAAILAEKGVTTVEDLLYYLPFRYEDRLNPRGINELRPGEMASIIAEVRGAMLLRTRVRRVPMFQMTAGQGPSRLKCLWFHGEYLEDKFKAGQLVALYGKVERDERDGELQVINPQFEILSDPDHEGDAVEAAERSLEVGRIVPIYESAGKGKVSSRWFRRIIHAALENLPPNLPEAIPAAVRKRMDLIDCGRAFWQAHWPEAGESLSALAAARTPAHRRLIFEELFFLELGLELKRKRQRTHLGVAFTIGEKVRETIKRVLPFHPTAAQKRVLKEIAEDMRRPVPMRRLLQGDVGSGKTIVALQAAIIAIENGYQAALMAPTEILASQHYFSARQILEKTGYRIVLLTGAVEAERKRVLRSQIGAGEAQLIIGTHALIQEVVEFARLGLVIVDEQHRFGVMQRFKLMKKTTEAEPDVLVMTATPIPRTLALTLYGDLDVSTLNELPPGRTPIVTRCVPDTRSDEVFEFVRKQAQAGHQAYIVYPVIEEGGSEGELKAAIKMYDELRKRVLPDLKIGLLHGRLSADEKELAMLKFQAGQIQVLVATTVIEVGVDVPNANVMVVEHAERFGLAQLHQLRGRIGRGVAKSYCVLMTGGKVTPEAQQRLDALVRTTDGFLIAEQDLEQRGPGEFFGTKQAGMPTLRVANLIRDRELLEAAKREAALVAARPSQDISAEEISTAMHHLRTHWQRRYGLVEVG